MANNILVSIIENTIKEHGVHDYHIPPETVQSQVKQQRLSPKHRGTPSPLPTP